MAPFPRLLQVPIPLVMESIPCACTNHIASTSFANSAVLIALDYSRYEGFEWYPQLFFALYGWQRFLQLLSAGTAANKISMRIITGKNLVVIMKNGKVYKNTVGGVKSR